MLKICDLKVGDKVCYVPEHYLENNKFENGVVKEIPSFAADTNSVRVVYNCAGNWDDYANYTSALTNLRDLVLGWR